MSSCDLSRDFFYSCWAFSPINLVELLVLGWPFYNSKSCKPNKLASLFRRRVLVTLRPFIRAPYLAQWLDLPLAAKPQNPLFSDEDELADAAFTKDNNTPAVSYTPFPLLLRQLVLRCPLWPNTQRMTSSGSSRPFWIVDLLLLLRLLHLNNTKALIRGLWRPGSWTYIRVKLIWSAITSSSSMRTILPLQRPRVKMGYHLPPLSSKIPPCFDCRNTSRT